MPVTITQNNKKVSADKARRGRAPGRIPGANVDPAQVEVFGRLRFTTSQMADYYGISDAAMAYHLQKEENAKALRRGRANVAFAVRQKQLQIALGSDAKYDEQGRVLQPASKPNPDMLKYAGRHFAEQKEVVEVEHHGIGISWGQAAREEAERIRERLVSSGIKGADA